MKWISINEDLPNEDEAVLVWANGDWHYSIYEWSHYTRVMEFKLPLSVYASDASHKDVTHWSRVEGPK